MTSHMAGRSEKLASSNYSELQLEANRQTEFLDQIKETFKRIQKKLSGLKYNPSSVQEIIKQPKENRILELKQRQESIDWLLSSQSSDYDEDKIKLEDLKDARYFTVKELIERAKEKLDLLEQIILELKNPTEQPIALKILADKYSFQKPNLFDFNREQGALTLKNLDEQELQAEIEQFTKYVEAQRFIVAALADILNSSRTGIDPGALFIGDRDKLQQTIHNDMVGGTYLTKHNFRGDLALTGLIILPQVLNPITLKHEYLHFEDLLLKPQERPLPDALITELHSLLMQNFFMDGNNHINEERFEAIKASLIKFYLPEIKKVMPDLALQRDMEEKIIKTVDAIKHLFVNGFSLEVIKTIIMQSNRFDDIISWSNVSDEDLKMLIDSSRQCSNLSV